jgi:hypothetical protein
MNRLMNILMLSCRKATELIEKDLYFKLSLIEKIQLRMHISMCDFCTRYKKQSGLLHNILQRFEHDHHQTDMVPGSSVEDLKSRITNQLDQS